MDKYKTVANIILILNVILAVVVLPVYFGFSLLSWMILESPDVAPLQLFSAVVGMRLPLLWTPPLLALSAYHSGKEQHQKSLIYGLCLMIPNFSLAVLVLVPVAFAFAFSLLKVQG